MFMDILGVVRKFRGPDDDEHVEHLTTNHSTFAGARQNPVSQSGFLPEGRRVWCGALKAGEEVKIVF